MPDLNFGFVVFPDVTQLDFTGPLQVMGRLPGTRTHIVAKTLDAIATDSVLKIPPTTTFDDCPQLDLICVPGGFGVAAAMADPETIDFVRRQGKSARYVTSVCTGAFILGTAGLLAGRRATTHWAYTDLLPLVGATHEKARVVRDGNVFTAGGVTSGIDFGLTITAELVGPAIAQAIQLGIEYDPAPPFNAGHPDHAPAEAKALFAGRYDSSRRLYTDAIARAKSL